MALYPEFKQLDLVQINKDILQLWNQTKAFEKGQALRAGATPFVFYEGPPSANGIPGIHHVMSRTLKDLVCRYQNLKGHYVPRKSGWDTHGLPIELQVEKKLKITKEDIGHSISVAEYNQHCREDVMKFTHEWEDLTTKMGYWVDLKNPYVTYHNQYIGSVWSLLKRLWQKGLLYKGYTIQPFSPAAGTGLSSHELNQPGTYKMVKDTSVVAIFTLKHGQKLPFSPLPALPIGVMAWTTTPWTLPSNTALTVGPKISYALVETVNPYTGQLQALILAEALMPKYFKPEHEGLPATDWVANKITPWRKIATCTGNQLKGLHYEQLLPYVQPQGNAFTILTGDFVTTEDGTGIVHTAPSFGADDFKVAREHGIGALTLVDRQGRFVQEVVDFAHEPVKEAYLTEEEKQAWCTANQKEKYLSVDERIAIKLKTEGKAFKVEKFEHTYPHCWRTDKPILYYPLDSWFIRTTAYKDRLAELNKTINWMPESTGTGRFGNWLENLVDWNLSRSRYWGTPLPIWKTEDGKEEICIGSVEELALEVDKAVAAGLVTENKVTAAQCPTAPDTNWKATAIAEKMLDHLVIAHPEAGFIFGQSFGDFTVDAVSHALKMVVEVKPPQHPYQQEFIAQRNHFLENLGYHILVFSEYEVDQQWEMVRTALKANIDHRRPFLQQTGFDLHRPFVDEIILVSPSGKPMYREPDLIDVWFDSGAMPYAQQSFTFEKQPEGLPDNFPAHFIAEGVDQTRGWFFTLHALGVLLFDSVAFKNVISNGLVLDKAGNKMSKRLGNAVDPFETLSTYGADATRWYMMSNAQPWDNLKFDLEGIKEVQRKFFGTLYNTYSFFALYANVDQYAYNPETAIAITQRTELDRWMISKLHSTLALVTQKMDGFDPTPACRAIEELVSDHLSNWFVRLSRRRFWKGEMSAEKQAAYDTLFESLLRIAQMTSPFAPFFSEWLYQNLKKAHPHLAMLAADSIHHTFWNTPESSTIDLALESKMEVAQTITSLGLSLRKKHNLKVRQPLASIMIPALDAAMAQDIKAMEPLIKSEINIKNINILSATDGIVTKKVKLNFKQLGAKVGALMKPLTAVAQQFTQEQITELEQNGTLHLLLEGNTFTLQLSDVEVLSEDIPGWVVASNKGITVALDTSLNNALIQEGIARELVNRIQNMRKQSDLQLTDKITVYIAPHAYITEAVDLFSTYISTETLAKAIVFEEHPNAIVQEIDDQHISIAIEK